MTGKILIVALAVQVISAVFFLADSLISIFDLRANPIDWRVKELLEISAAIGLLIGSALGAVAVRYVLAASNKAEAGIRVASGAFHEMMEENFENWGLSVSERDIAMLMLKGLSIREIAAIRESSEGTVKSHSNALYRKANVTGRGQLQSIFIEDLMDGGVAPRARDKTPVRSD
ncbi:helix-turn-helix transcriptional regulator [Litoreibacter arenae]|uniref:Transcriptional regulator, LuxR family n=1 Tax=Litoreibacter arenae DSM 19593 TaxID=1123360 RepID=S9RPY8_9RHOB|nr:LuxR C-terminal-related transcriptional regulator [Litoreibacter arenae]EPX80100.1 transcriptional regulator, LuxR family [Litoreibacter arenae DSM 19593]